MDVDVAGVAELDDRAVKCRALGGSVHGGEEGVFSFERVGGELLKEQTAWAHWGWRETGRPWLTNQALL
jgi:hypothetical protein